MNLLPYRSFIVDAPFQPHQARRRIDLWLQESPEFEGKWRNEFEFDVFCSKSSLFQPAVHGLIGPGERATEVVVYQAPGVLTLLLMTVLASFVLLQTFDGNNMRALATISGTLVFAVVMLVVTCSRRMAQMDPVLQQQIKAALSEQEEDGCHEDQERK